MKSLAVGINIASTVAIENLEIDRMVVSAKQKKTSKKDSKILEESDEERESHLDAVRSQPLRW